MPRGACDCHVHVVGAAGRYPMDPDRPYTPAPAGVQDLRAHLARLSLERAVIVQPSVYGTDNRCLLDALREMDGAARGIAVVADDADDRTLERLAAAGVAGVRLNLESTGRGDPDAVRGSLAKWSPRLAGLDWHVQIYASFQTMAAALDGLDALRVPLVLDHFAMVPAGTPAGDAGLARLLAWLRDGRLYVKLSGAYRLPGAAGHAARELAGMFIAANPDRILWASDWPHTNRDPGKERTQVSAYRRVDPAGLFAEIHDWLPGEALLRKVLVDNPAALYRF
ncbi:amidohydrolase [Candidimonas nitroreducens]|uniref:Amidohydrolase n=1 Tax=Candidimonas nitroreducens TaxID=683354 RepID=A0A225M355_9BURK|nr:amidohydrolase [Candidimonas nitroreducens]